MMNNELKLDCRGKACPLPLIETKKAVEGMTDSGIVAVQVDNEIAVQNLQKLAAQRQLHAEVEATADGNFTVRLTVPAGNALAAKAAELLPECEDCAPAAKRGVVIAVGADHMGEGAPELGKLLLKSFLFAATKQDTLPKTMLFYNGGAALTCEGSESLEDLRTLADAGVEILTCGTCLSFYGLSEKLAVGGVSNMYEIVQKQMEASEVIRP